MKDGSLAAGGGVYKHHSGHCRGQWRDFKVENGLSNSLSSARDPVTNRGKGQEHRFGVKLTSV